MNLLIVKKDLLPNERPDAAYRGTERYHPAHFDNLPDSHVANQLFFWFLEESGGRGVVHDLKKAKQLVEVLNLFGNTVFYEVVQVSTDRFVEPGRGGFLGFDISAGYNNSLVKSVLLLVPGEGRQFSVLPGDGHVLELSKLHRSHFRPKLNDHCLFQTYDDADHCLRTAKALNMVRPGWLEESNLGEYAVTTLQKVL